MGTFDGMVPMSSEPPDPKAAARQVIEQHRQQLLDCGWRQGSVLPPELALQVPPVLEGYAAPTDGWPSTRHYIVVSQDCDVVQGDFTKEPLVEVVLATKKKPFDPYRSLRNPRVLHLELSDLHAADFDMGLLGFDADGLAVAMGLEDGLDGEAPAPDAGINYQEKFAVLVACEDEPGQQQCFEKLTGMGFACKVLVN